MNLAAGYEVDVGFPHLQGRPCSGCFAPLSTENYLVKVVSGGKGEFWGLCPDCLEFLITPSAPGVQ